MVKWVVKCRRIALKSYVGLLRIIILPEKNLNVQASTRNIEGAKAILANTINVYDLLRYTNLVLTLDTVKKLEEVYA